MEKNNLYHVDYHRGFMKSYESDSSVCYYMAI